jgi:ribosomal protein S18 acetylase RimI-like enzyme
MTFVARAASVTIRQAAPADARAIAAVFVDSAEHHARLDPLRYHVPAMDAIEARYAEERPASAGVPGVTLVAERRGEVVGFVEARCEASPDPMHKNVIFCHVTEIAVGGDHRGGGIGTELLRAAEEWGRSQGAAFAVLEYHAANTRAGEFYRRRMGYAVAAITAIKPL